MVRPGSAKAVTAVRVRPTPPKEKGNTVKKRYLEIMNEIKRLEAERETSYFKLFREKEDHLEDFVQEIQLVCEKYGLTFGVAEGVHIEVSYQQGDCLGDLLGFFVNTDFSDITFDPK